MLRGESPVVIGDPVRLLQLHLHEPAPEVLQPGVWIALGAFGSGHALVADVEAEPPRGVLAIAVGEQILDLRHRRRLAHRHQVFDEEVFEPHRGCMSGDGLEVALQTVPAFGSALGNTPVRDAHRSDVPPGGPGSQRRGEIDDAAVPLQRRFTPPLVGVHEEVERVRRQAGEGGVGRQPVGVESSAVTFDGISAAGEGLDALDEVE